MPPRLYEYDCGHVRPIKGNPFVAVPFDNPCFDIPFAAHPPQQRCPSAHYPETSAAAALENLDSDRHAGLAGIPTPRRHSIRFDTQIHTPRSAHERRGSGHIRTSRVGQVVLSLKKPDKSRSHCDRKFFRDYPCEDCRRYELLERQRCAVETRRLWMGLRPPPYENQRGTGGNRYRGDDWYEDYEREMVKKVRFEEGS